MFACASDRCLPETEAGTIVRDVAAEIAAPGSPPRHVRSH